MAAVAHSPGCHLDAAAAAEEEEEEEAQLSLDETGAAHLHGRISV